MTDEDPRQTDLADVRARVFEIESSLSDLGLQLEWNRAVADLHALPAWKQLIARLQTVANAEQKKIVQQRMDAYELGKRQGKLAVLNVVTQLEPLQRKALDAIEQEASVLREQLESERQLLR